jgi:hypothetical protein
MAPAAGATAQGGPAPGRPWSGFWRAERGAGLPARPPREGRRRGGRGRASGGRSMAPGCRRDRPGRGAAGAPVVGLLAGRAWRRAARDRPVRGRRGRRDRASGGRSMAPGGRRDGRVRGGAGAGAVGTGGRSVAPGWRRDRRVSGAARAAVVGLLAGGAWRRAAAATAQWAAPGRLRSASGGRSVAPGCRRDGRVSGGAGAAVVGHLAGGAWRRAARHRVQVGGAAGAAARPA